MSSPISQSRKNRLEIVPFEPYHANEVKKANGTPYDPDEEWKCHGGPAYTILVDGEIVVCCGIYLVNDILGECWMVTTPKFYSVYRIVYPAMKDFFGKVLKSCKVRKVRAIMSPDFIVGQEFARHMGFKNVGTYTVLEREC